MVIFCLSQGVKGDGQPHLYGKGHLLEGTGRPVSECLDVPTIAGAFPRVSFVQPFLVIFKRDFSFKKSVNRI